MNKSISLLWDLFFSICWGWWCAGQPADLLSLRCSKMPWLSTELTVCCSSTRKPQHCSWLPTLGVSLTVTKHFHEYQCSFLSQRPSDVPYPDLYHSAPATRLASCSRTELRDEGFSLWSTEPKILGPGFNPVCWLELGELWKWDWGISHLLRKKKMSIWSIS